MAKTSTPRVRLPFQRRAQDPGGGVDQGADAPGPRIGTQSGLPVSGETLFYLVVGLVLAAYTVMAFGMEWQTGAGRVGPGLFPRIIGVLGVAVCLVGGVRAALIDRRGSTVGKAPDAGAEEAAETRAAEDPAPDAAGQADAAADAEEPGAPAKSEEETRHPWTVVALCAILAAFVTVMVPVGAVLTGALALAAALLLCDRSRPVRSAVLAVVFPAALYFVFVYLLNAPLPSGVIPL